MKTFTINNIRSWKPCYEPTNYLPEDWVGTALDILKNKNIPIQDQFWCIYREGLISEKTLRLFAVWSYRQTLQFVKNPDSRSLKAAEVAEAYALGNATSEELVSAESAAWSAVESAAESAGWPALELAVESSAKSAAWSAAKSVSWSMAKSAAWSATWSAAESAAKSASWSAAESAWSAQRDKLIELLEQE